MTRGTTRLRDLLARPGIVMAPGAFDALSARLASRAGFDAIYMTGGGVAATLLGQPDIGLVTLTEVADVVRRLTAVIDQPLLVDADTGFGGVINVMRTVEVLESAGAAALQLEDQTSPKRCGHLRGKTLIDATEFATKVRAACDHRADPDLVVIARTDAIAVEGLDAAIDRAKRYRDAGADVIFVEAPESRAQLEAIAQRVAAPLLVNLAPAGRTPSLPASVLGEMGYKIVIYPATTLMAAAEAMVAALASLLQEGRDPLHDRRWSAEEFFAMLGMDDWLAADAKYGTTDAAAQP